MPIELPALDYRPPQQENIMQQFSQAYGLKNMLQENQARQLQLKEAQQDFDDQNKIRSLFMQNNGDMNATIQGAAKAGVSPKTLLGLQTAHIDQQTTMAALTKDQLENQTKQNDMMRGGLTAVNNAAPEDRPDVYSQQLTSMKASGIDTSKFPATYPGDDVWGKQFPSWNASLAGAAKYNEEENTRRKTAADLASSAAKLPGEQADSQIKGAEANALQNGGMTQPVADSKYRQIQQTIAAKQPISQDDRNFVAAYEKQKKLVPMSVAQVRLQGMGTMRQFPVFDNQSKQTVYLDSNEINDAKLREPGRYTVPSYTPEAEIQKQTGKTFGPGGKGSEEVLAFNTALQHANLLQQASDALKNGDVRALNSAGNALGVQFGSDKKTNFQVIANAYTREVTKALSAGHLTDSEISQQGATMPANASPEQISGALGAYKSLMASKVQLRKQQFEQGKQGQPNFGNPSSGMVRIKASDGTLHDIPSGNLDKAKQIDPGLQVQ